MSELENAISNLKIALQNKPLYGNNTQEEIIKLLPFIEKAHKNKQASDAILLDIVLITVRLLDFQPSILNKKGKKERYVYDSAYYGDITRDKYLDLHRIEMKGIHTRKRCIEYPSQYSEVHDEFEKLIDAVPGKRNECLTSVAVAVVSLGLMMTLIGGLIPLYPILTAGILIVVLGLITAVYNYVRTGFAKQMSNVAQAREDDEKNIFSKKRSDQHGNNPSFFEQENSRLSQNANMNDIDGDYYQQNFGTK